MMDSASLYPQPLGRHRHHRAIPLFPFPWPSIHCPLTPLPFALKSFSGAGEGLGAPQEPAPPRAPVVLSGADIVQENEEEFESSADGDEDEWQGRHARAKKEAKLRRARDRWDPEWAHWENSIFEDTVLVGFARMILHTGEYQSGDRLSPEHEKVVVERLLTHNPEHEKMMGCGIDYITVVRITLVWLFSQSLHYLEPWPGTLNPEYELQNPPEDKDGDNTSLGKDVQLDSINPSTGEKSKGRGSNADSNKLSEDTRILVTITPSGEAEGYPPFTTKLGMMVTMIVPLSYFNWRKVPKELKKHLLQELNGIFNWGDDSNVPKYILKHASKIHRNWRAKMNRKFYKNKSYDEALRNVPPTIESDIWRQACEHWRNSSVKVKMTRNKESNKLLGDMRILVTITPRGEAEGYPPFSTELSTMVKKIVSFSYFDWRKVPKELKMQLLQELNEIFDWGDDRNVPKYILNHASKIHYSWRANMKRKPNIWSHACERWRNPPTKIKMIRNVDSDRLSEDMRILVTITLSGEAKGYPPFTTKLGKLIMKIVPFSYFDWKKVPKKLKRQLIQELNAIFDWGDDLNVPKYILKHAGKTHRDWRARMKQKFYMNRSYDEALRNVPPKILPHIWRQACEHWQNPLTKEQVQKNKANRAKAPPQMHCLGRISIDEMKYRYSLMHAGSQLDRVRVYEITHSRVTSKGNREWINRIYQQKYDTMVKLMNSHEDVKSGIDQQSVVAEEAFRVVMPPEHRGYVRSAGRGETIQSWYGRKRVSSSADEGVDFTIEGVDSANSAPTTNT